MSPAAERVATFATGLGRRFTLHDLAAMTDMSLTELMDPVRELIQADLFAEDDSQLVFRHDLIRDAVRGSLLAPVRRALDRQAADVLLARGALPVEVAVQLTESSEPGDNGAITTVYEAAQALSISDPASAAELAAKALELTPLRHPLRGPLVARRVVSLFAAGLADEGKRFADSTLRQALPAEEEARVRFSVASMFDLSPEVRAENARAGLALPYLSDDLRAQLWAVLYHSLSVAGRGAEALEIEPSAARRRTRARTRPAGSRSSSPTRGLQYQLLEFRQAFETITNAERHELAGEEDARERLAHVLRIWILVALDRCEEAVESSELGVVAAQRDRQNWALRVFETTRGRLMLQMGRFAEAAVALEGRFTANEARLVAGALHAPSVVALGDLGIHTGDERGALEAAEIAKVMLRARGAVRAAPSDVVSREACPFPRRRNASPRLALRVRSRRAPLDVAPVPARGDLRRRAGPDRDRGGGRGARRACDRPCRTTRRAQPGRAFGCSRGRGRWRDLAGVRRRPRTSGEPLSGRPATDRLRVGA